MWIDQLGAHQRRRTRADKARQAHHRLATNKQGQNRQAFQDGLLFLTKWLRSPFKVAAVLPSGPDLAAAMAAPVPLDDDGYVVELGGGTGALTAGLLAHGVKPERLIVVERDAAFYKILRERFPSVTVLQGDAQDIRHLVALSGVRGSGPLSAIVSGLPILTFPIAIQERLLEESFALLGSDGVFVQFTYGFGPPVPAARLRKWGLTARQVGHAMRNVPPAHVWCFQRTG